MKYIVKRKKIHNLGTRLIVIHNNQYLTISYKKKIIENEIGKKLILCVFVKYLFHFKIDIKSVISAKFFFK